MFSSSSLPVIVNVANPSILSAVSMVRSSLLVMTRLAFSARLLLVWSSVASSIAVLLIVKDSSAAVISIVSRSELALNRTVLILPAILAVISFEASVKSISLSFASAVTSREIKSPLPTRDKSLAKAPKVKFSTPSSTTTSPLNEAKTTVSTSSTVTFPAVIPGASNSFAPLIERV